MDPVKERERELTQVYFKQLIEDLLSLLFFVSPLFQYRLNEYENKKSPRYYNTKNLLDYFVLRYNKVQCTVMEQTHIIYLQPDKVNTRILS